MRNSGKSRAATLNVARAAVKTTFFSTERNFGKSFAATLKVARAFEARLSGGRARILGEARPFLVGDADYAFAYRPRSIASVFGRRSQRFRAQVAVPVRNKSKTDR